ncbi:MAG TPA: hypothetical protein VLM18_12475 [Croceibacterium sp.]|nr:hypothetical protein [Croceibacterium sp.]
MATRFLISYALFALLLAGLAGAVWWMIYHNERNVRHRERRKRNERYKAGFTAPKSSPGEKDLRAD